MQAKKRRDRPKKVIIQEQSDSEEEARYPTMEEARYNLRQRRPEMERVRRQSERPETFETENESNSESEDNDEENVQGYDPESSNWIVQKLRARIEWEMKTKQRPASKFNFKCTYFPITKKSKLFFLFIYNTKQY
jgi:hypothetical protein